MKRVINAIKVLFGKLEIEVHVGEEVISSIVPHGVILKLTSDFYKIPKELLRDKE